VVNLKNATLALIVALAYEMLLKLSHAAIPFLFNTPAVGRVTSGLSIAVAAVIVLFLYLFLKEERSNKEVEAVVLLLAGCIVLRSILRFLPAREPTAYQALGLVRQIIGLATSVLLFVLVLFYRKGLASGPKLLKQAASLVAVMFGIGMIPSALSLAVFARFVVSAATIELPPLFYSMMLVLFLMTRTAVIYFLLQYHRLKSYAG
jgi:hypothetical protein